MTRSLRAIAILWVVLRVGLDELVLSSFRAPWLAVLSRIVTFGQSLIEPLLYRMHCIVVVHSGRAFSRSHRFRNFLVRQPFCHP